MTDKSKSKLLFVGMPKPAGSPIISERLWEQLKTGKFGDWDVITQTFSGYGISKARNHLTWQARKFGATKMLTLDADVDMSEAQLLRLLSHDSQGQMVVGGMYPAKRLDKLVWVCNFIGLDIEQSGLARALDFGGGCGLWDMSVIEQMIERWPETAFESEDDGYRGEIMHDLWAQGVIQDDWGSTFKTGRRYVTEDFYMCWRARKLGIDVWVDTLVQLGHVGAVDFTKMHGKLVTKDNRIAYLEEALNKTEDRLIKEMSLPLTQTQISEMQAKWDAQIKAQGVVVPTALTV